MFAKVALLTTVLLRAIAPAAADGDDLEKVNFIFSDSGFSTTTNAGGGNEVGHTGGFSFMDAAGNTEYSNENPWGYSPCVLGGAYNVYTSDCIDGNVTMKCSTNSVGVTESCSATYSNGYEYKGTAGDDYAFYGVFVTSGSHCGGYFESPLDCSADGMEWTLIDHYTG